MNTGKSSEPKPDFAVEAQYDDGAQSAGAAQPERRIIRRYNVLGMHFDVDQRYSLIDVVGRGVQRLHLRHAGGAAGGGGRAGSDPSSLPDFL